MSTAPTRYQVWWKPQVPMKSFIREVPDLATAKILVEVLADYDLFQYDNNIKPDYSNAGGIEVWEDGEWVEVPEEEEW